DQDVVPGHVEVRVVDARAQVLEPLEDHGSSFDLEERRRRGRALEDRAARRERAGEHDEPPHLRDRVVEGADVAIPFDPREVFQFKLCWLDSRYLSKANQAFVDVALEEYRAKARPRLV